MRPRIELHKFQVCPALYRFNDEFVPSEKTRNMWTVSLLSIAAVLSSVSSQFLPADYHFGQPYRFPPQFNPQQFNPQPQYTDNIFPRARNLNDDYHQPAFNPYFNVPYYFLFPRIVQPQQDSQITSRQSSSHGNIEKHPTDAERGKPETTFVPAPTNGQFGGPLYVTAAKPSILLGSIGITNNNIDEQFEVVPLLTFQPQEDFPDVRPVPQWFNKRSNQFYSDNFNPDYFH